ncbi:MAG: BolA family protein [Rickettsiales bacterium]
MSIIKTMETKLQDAFAPQALQIGNDSAQHEGHAGAREAEGDVSHVSIVVVSDKFAGMSRVARSRAVHAAIADEIKQIHAITMLKTLTPEEAA